MQGMHDALSNAGAYKDKITDVTLMDSSYSYSHFADAAKWILSGSPGKALRIIGSPHQITTKKKFHEAYFGKSAIASRAKKAGFKVTHLSVAGDQPRKQDQGRATHARAYRRRQSPRRYLDYGRQAQPMRRFATMSWTMRSYRSVKVPEVRTTSASPSHHRRPWAVTRADWSKPEDLMCIADGAAKGGAKGGAGNVVTIDKDDDHVEPVATDGLIQDQLKEESRITSRR